MSNVVEFTHRIADADRKADGGVFDFTTNLQPPLNFKDGGVSVIMQVLELNISDLVLNIFDGRPWGVNFYNLDLLVANNLDVDPITLLPIWHRITLRPGKYATLATIGAAINQVVGEQWGWWTDPKDPGFTLDSNFPTKKALISIDSSKLLPAHGTQFMIDFRKSTTGSDLYDLLGLRLPGEGLIAVDGVAEPSGTSNTNPQGYLINVCCSLAPTRRVNQTDKPILATIPQMAQQYQLMLSWPSTGKKSPKMYITSLPRVYSYRVWAETSDGKPMIFSAGSISGKFAFYIRK